MRNKNILIITITLVIVFLTVFYILFKPVSKEVPDLNNDLIEVETVVPDKDDFIEEEPVFIGIQIFNNHHEKFNKDKNRSGFITKGLSHVPIYHNAEKTDTTMYLFYTLKNDELVILSIGVDVKGKTMEQYVDGNVNGINSIYETYRERDTIRDILPRVSNLNNENLGEVQQKYINRLSSLNRSLYYYE